MDSIRVIELRERLLSFMVFLQDVVIIEVGPAPLTLFDI